MDSIEYVEPSMLARAVSYPNAGTILSKRILFQQTVDGVQHTAVVLETGDIIRLIYVTSVRSLPSGTIDTISLLLSSDLTIAHVKYYLKHINVVYTFYVSDIDRKEQHSNHTSYKYAIIDRNDREYPVRMYKHFHHFVLTQSESKIQELNSWMNANQYHFHYKVPVTVIQNKEHGSNTTYTFDRSTNISDVIAVINYDLNLNQSAFDTVLLYGNQLLGNCSEQVQNVGPSKGFLVHLYLRMKQPTVDNVGCQPCVCKCPISFNVMQNDHDSDQDPIWIASAPVAVPDSFVSTSAPTRVVFTTMNAVPTTTTTTTTTTPFLYTYNKQTETLNEPDFFTYTVHGTRYTDTAHAIAHASSGAQHVQVVLDGTNAITSYDIIVFVISPNDIGIVTREVQVYKQISTRFENPSSININNAVDVRFIIENYTPVPLNDVQVSFKLNDKLEWHSDAPKQVIPLLGPSESYVIDVPVVGVRAGSAQIHATIVANGKTEHSRLSTPLRIELIGSPNITRFHALVSNDEPFVRKVQVTGKEWYSKLQISIQPDIFRVIKQTVEESKSQEYAGCDQILETLIPVQILYQHNTNDYKLHQRLIDEFKKLVRCYDARSGGFSVWPGKTASLQQTALAMRLSSQIQDIIGSNHYNLNARKYLFDMQRTYNHWEDENGIIDNDKMTALIVQGLSASGFLHTAGFNYLEQRFNTSHTDALAITLAAASYVTLQRTKSRYLKQLTKAVVEQQAKDGSWDHSEETTSHALVGLCKLCHGKSCNDKIVSGVNYLMLQRRATGWKSTKDTMYAIMAIDACSKYITPFEEGIVTVEVNDQVLRKLEITKEINPVERQDVLQQLQLFSTDELVKGTNTIKVHVQSPQLVNVVVEKHDYLPSTKTGNVYLSASTQKPKVGETVRVTVKFTPNHNARNHMIQVKIPSGFEFAEGVEKSKEIDSWEAKRSYWFSKGTSVVFYVSEMKQGVQIHASFEMKATYSGYMIIEGAEVHDLNDRDKNVVGESLALSVIK